MVLPVTFSMTSLSSTTLGFGQSTVRHGSVSAAKNVAEYGGTRVRMSARTDLDIVRAHPSQGLHRFSRGVGILLTVAVRVGDVLLGGGIAAMAQCLLDKVGSL